MIDHVTTAVGEFWYAHEDGTVTAAVFGSELDLLARLGLESAVHSPGPAKIPVRRYFDGEKTALDGLPVAQPGSDFFATCWAALRTIPYGKTRSYGALAAQLGRPTAARAVASACAHNRVALIVPCHRVVRADGGISGYRWGTSIKEYLLRHEG